MSTRRSVRRRLVIAMAWCVCGLSTPAAGATDVIGGSLGRWLDTQAVPQLAKVLSGHPKFKGEVIVLATFKDGQPTRESNALAEAIREYLTHALLRRGSVRIAWRGQDRKCAMTTAAPYVLGIEIKRAGSWNSIVRFSMIDVEEGVWVSGVNAEWKGRLTTVQKAAMSTPEIHRERGTLANPVRLSDASTVAKLLTERIRCSVTSGRGDWSGTVAWPEPDSAELARISAAMRNELTRAPAFDIAGAAEEADWTLRVAERPLAEGRTNEIVVTIKPTRGTLPSQRLAAVFTVKDTPASSTAKRPMERSELRPAQPRPVKQPREPAAIPQPAAAEAPRLLSDIQATRRSRRCSTRRDSAHCAELEVELYAPAYLVFVHTRNSSVHSNACGTASSQQKPGLRRYRLKLGSDERVIREPIGFYAIATNSRYSLRALEQLLRRSPGSCSSGSRGMPVTSWLDRLDSFLYEHRDRLDYKSVRVRPRYTLASAVSDTQG